MKKILFLLFICSLLLGACSEESKSSPTEAKENETEEDNTKEMSKTDALYYLEQITKNYLNVSYHNVFNEETEDLLSEGIENIDSALKEIEDNFNTDDPLVIEVKEVASIVRSASEEYLSTGNDNVLVDASEEVGANLGAITREYLDGEIPYTMEKITKEFSDESEPEIGRENNSISDSYLDTGNFIYEITEIEQVTSERDENIEVLAVEMNFTNNSDKPMSAWAPIGISVEQETENTVENLNGGNYFLPDDYKPELAELYNTKVKPGSSIDVVIAYEILYPGSPVRLYDTFGQMGGEIVFERIVETE